MKQASEAGPDAIVFEQPLNERVRTFLRLEFLFGCHAHHAQDTHPFGVRGRLHAMLDIFTVLGRADLKKDILKELVEQHAVLTRLANRPGIDPARLHQVLSELTGAANDLQQLATTFSASALRDNEFLLSVLNRSTIPGGTCAFDLPAYHHWLSQPIEVQQNNLDAWFAHLRPFARGIQLYLSLLRGSTTVKDAVAHGGNFVHAPQGPCQLLRVFVPRELSVYPEISAGAHRFTLRFMHIRDVNQRSSQANKDIPFRLQCCAL